MTIIEEFSTILEKTRQAAIIPFLKGLTPSQKKELPPTIKKLSKYYQEFAQRGISGGYSMRGTEAQLYILGAAAFVCCNQKDFEQAGLSQILKKEHLDGILPWHCPSWFNSFINKLATAWNNGGISYGWYMEMVEQGYLDANPEFIARLLPEFIFEQNDNHQFTYKPINLAKRDITLAEHIWYLFEYDPMLHAIENYRRFTDDSTPGRWQQAFKTYTAQGKIDRDRLLKTALASAAKSTNQAAAGWFIDLFGQLEPSKQELLALQGNLLHILNQSNTKPIGAALKLLKELAMEPDFDETAFIDHIPMILTAESKGNIASALMILEKLAKKHPDRAEQICVTASHAFIQQDNALQLRVAKLLLKYGDASSLIIREAVATYYDSLFAESRELLATRVDEVTSGVTEEEQHMQHLQEPTQIHLPGTFDELVFLASQAFDHNESFHFDLLPAALLKFQKQMTAENVVKLLPAFQRAYKVITGEFPASMGYLDNLLATFFVDYGQVLVALQPREAEPVRLMRESFEQKEQEKKAKWSSYDARFLTIKGWNVGNRSEGYKPHKHLLLNAYFLLERKIELPLLSTPTHAPCWVSPIALVERLSKYQAAKVIPADMDFQIAVARCTNQDKEDALQLALTKLSGEYRQIISFILGGEYFPQENYNFKLVWLVAALTRNSTVINSRWFDYSGLSEQYLTGRFNWESKIEHYKESRYNYETRRNEEFPATRKALIVEFGNREKTTIGILKGWLNKLLPKKQEPDKSLYDYLVLKYNFISMEHNDIMRLLYLNPNHTNVLLAYVIGKAIRYVDFGESEKQLVLNSLQALMEIGKNYGSMANLLIATSMICADKTVRVFAAEIWLQGVSQQTINTGKIGQIIGMHERVELMPLKRFTDLILSNMFQVSALHNAALGDLMAHVIIAMADKPINNTKKLLEVYAEVLSTTRGKIESPEVLAKLKTWSAAEVLAKPIEKLMKLAG